MARIKSPVFKLSVFIGLQLSIIAGFSILVSTRSPLLAQGLPTRWEAKAYQPRPGIGAPSRREQGGTRGLGTCPATEKRLTALVPTNSFGVTVAAYPTFLFYIPKMKSGTPAKQVEFMLIDDNENEVYKATFKTTGKSGIVSISLPPDAGLKPLQAGKDYRWYFSLLCNPQDRAGDMFVDGRIRRVELNSNVREQLQQATPTQKAKLYAKQEIWFDALKTMAELRRSNPNDSAVASEWEQLLKSVQLDEIATESLVPSAIAPSRELTSSQL